MSTAVRWYRTAWFNWVLGVVIAVLLLVLPLIADPFTNQIISKIAVFAVAVLGLNIVMGYAGQVSLGQIFFVGFGAYSAGWVVNSDWGRSLGFGGIVIAFILSFLFPGIVGLAVGLAAARLRGLAIAMVTVALPLVGVPLAKRFSDVTGGAQGENVHILPRASEWKDAPIAIDQAQYYICVLIAAGVFALAFFLVRGKYGRAFAIVKSNEAVAGSMGVSPYRTKVLAMTIAAMVGGVSGFLFLVVNQYTSPDTMGFGHSIELVIATIVGGAGSIVGSVIGGAYYVLLPILSNNLPGSHDVVEGIVILLALFLLPGGLASLPRVVRRLSRRGRGHRVEAGSTAAPADRNTENH